MVFLQYFDPKLMVISNHWMLVVADYYPLQSSSGLLGRPNKGEIYGFQWRPIGVNVSRRPDPWPVQRRSWYLQHRNDPNTSWMGNNIWRAASGLTFCSFTSSSHIDDLQPALGYITRITIAIYCTAFKFPSIAHSTAEDGSVVEPYISFVVQVRHRL